MHRATGYISKNRVRHLKGLITVDAWHDKPTEFCRTVDLTAYVNFTTARMGDDVYFRLRLKRAEISVVVIGEPKYYIDPAKIWRGHRGAMGTATHDTVHTYEQQHGAGARAGVSSSGIDAGIDANIQSDSSRKSQQTIEARMEVGEINASYSDLVPEKHTWILHPSGVASNENPTGKFLNGSPWDERKTSLLSLTDRRTDIQGQDIPEVKIVIKCLREDLDFHDIHYIDENGNKYTTDNDAKQIAAAEYLKMKLLESGLHAEDMSRPFSMVILGEVMAEPRSVLDHGG